MQIKNIYYKSDFSITEKSETGYAVPFRFKYYTSAPSRAFIASFDGNNYHNCHLDSDGNLVVSFDDHNMGLGVLMIKRTFFVNSDSYESGVCDYELAPEKVVIEEDFGDGNIQYFNVSLSSQGDRESLDLVMNQKADKAAIKELQDKVARMEIEQSTFVQGDIKDAIYNSFMESNPVATDEYGSDDPSDLFDFVMVDHNTAENEDGTVDYTLLQRNNIFREKAPYDNFVKSVSITDEEMQAATDTTAERVIMVGDNAVKTFAAGEDYDAESALQAVKDFYAATEGTDKYLLAITMTVGGVAGKHAVMPWETTSQDMSIYIGNTRKLWLIDHQQGKSGKVHTAILRNHRIIDGIDPAGHALEATGLTPSGVFTVSKDGTVATRCHFTTRTGMANCVGGKGEGGVCQAFYGNGTYPRVDDMQQVTLMIWARANNSNAERSYPHAEGGYHALNTQLCALEIEHKTKYLHDPNLFSSGISTNDGCSNESQLFARTGFRYRASGAISWSYSTWSQDVNIYKSGGTTKYKSYNVINYEYPKERSMESQMAASWAAEMGIGNGVHFATPYGGEYWFENVSGAQGAISGKMAVRLYSMVRSTVNAYNASNEATSFEVEIVLRIGLYNGAQFAGDIFRYCGGGCEIVSTVTTSAQAASGYTGNIPKKIYLEPDQRRWKRETSVSKDNLGMFDFESAYPLIGDLNVSGANAYATDRLALTPFRISAGGGINTYQCFYTWAYNYHTNSVNRRARIALRFFGDASISNDAPRSLIAASAVSHAYRDLGGLAQVLLGTARHAQ